MIDKAETDLQNAYPDVAAKVMIFRHTRGYDEQVNNFLQQIEKTTPLTEDERQDLRNRMGESYDNYANNRLTRDGNGVYTASTSDLKVNGQSFAFIITPPPDFLPPERHAGVIGHELDHAITHTRDGANDKPLASYERMVGERAAIASEFAYQYAQNPTPETANDLRALHDKDLTRIVSENPTKAAFMNDYALPAEAREEIFKATDDALAAGQKPSLALAEKIGHGVATTYKPSPGQWAASEAEVSRLSADYANSGKTPEAFSPELSNYGDTGKKIAAAQQAEVNRATPAAVSQIPTEKFHTTPRTDFGRELNYISGVETNLGTTRALIGTTEDGKAVLGLDADNDRTTGVNGYESFRFADKDGTVSVANSPAGKQSVIAENAAQAKAFYEDASTITQSGHRNFSDLDLAHIKASALGLVKTGTTTDGSTLSEGSAVSPLPTSAIAPATQQAASTGR